MEYLTQKCGNLGELEKVSRLVRSPNKPKFPEYTQGCPQIRGATLYAVRVLPSDP